MSEMLISKEDKQALKEREPLLVQVPDNIDRLELLIAIMDEDNDERSYNEMIYVGNHGSRDLYDRISIKANLEGVRHGLKLARHIYQARERVKMKRYGDWTADERRFMSKFRSWNPPVQSPEDDET